MSKKIEKIKVLAVNASDNAGGAAKAAYRIHKGVNMIDEGVCSTMLVKHKSLNDDTIIGLASFLPKSKIYKAFAWIRTKVKNKYQHAQWGLYPKRDKIFMSDCRSTALHGGLQKLDYDVLHLHWINDRFVGLKDLRKIEKPIVWTLHDSWPMCGVCHYFFDCEKYQQQCGNCPQLHSNRDNDLSRKVWLKKWNCYAKLNICIVTPSEWFAKCVRKSSLFRDRMIKVIPNCIDENVFKPLCGEDYAKHWHWYNEKTRYLLFGAVNATSDAIKGFDLLCKALDLVKDYMENVELIVFGVNEDVQAPIPTHSVGYINDIEEIVNLYNISDVTIVPSRTETFGQTALESLACGTPVVAFNCTGIAEIIKHKETGYLAEAYDTNNLAQGIEWCLENNVDGILSKNARERVVTNYTQERIAKMYAKLYKEVAK